jgi:hypothetical protein
MNIEKIGTSHAKASAVFFATVSTAAAVAAALLPFIN